jgi:hypothetical protein
MKITGAKDVKAFKESYTNHENKFDDQDLAAINKVFGVEPQEYPEFAKMFISELNKAELEKFSDIIDHANKLV